MQPLGSHFWRLLPLWLVTLCLSHADNFDHAAYYSFGWSPLSVSCLPFGIVNSMSTLLGNRSAFYGIALSRIDKLQASCGHLCSHPQWPFSPVRWFAWLKPAAMCMHDGAHTKSLPMGQSMSRHAKALAWYCDLCLFLRYIIRKCAVAGGQVRDLLCSHIQKVNANDDVAIKPESELISSD